VLSDNEKESLFYSLINMDAWVAGKVGGQEDGLLCFGVNELLNRCFDDWLGGCGSEWINVWKDRREWASARHLKEWYALKFIFLNTH